MSRTAIRLVTATFVVGSAAIGFVPLAQADTTTTIAPTTEGWYQPNPSCAAPVGCLTPSGLPAPTPATSPYPARSLHVGYTAGQETARTYLALPTAGTTLSLTAGHLTVPLDTAAADGDSNSATAKLQVCLTFKPIVAVDGSVDAPPKTDCTASAAMTYVATPAPHFEADLASLLDRLIGATGLALLPDGTQAKPSDSWRVVFSAHDRTDAAKTAPASIALTMEDPPTAPSAEGQGAPLPDSGTPDFTAVAPPVGTGFAPGPAVDAPVVTGPAPAVVPSTTTGPVTVTQPRLITVGYAYPAVWLLPLGFLLLIPTVARALTRDLTPRT